MTGGHLLSTFSVLTAQDDDAGEAVKSSTRPPSLNEMKVIFFPRLLCFLPFHLHFRLLYNTAHCTRERVKFNFNSNPHTTQQRSLVLRFGILMTTFPSFRWALCHWFQISSIQHRLTESRGWSGHGDKCTNSTDYFGNQSPSVKQSMRYEEEHVRECGYKFLFFWQNLADFSQW